MPFRQRPELRLTTYEEATSASSSTGSGLAQDTRKSPVTTNIPPPMATDVRMPIHSGISPHVPSPRLQLPPISTYPVSTAYQPRPETFHDFGNYPNGASPNTYLPPRPQRPLESFCYRQPSLEDPPSARSPARSLSSYSPSVVPSVSSPRNFEALTGSKRSYDQAIGEPERSRGDFLRNFSSLTADTSTEWTKIPPPLHTASTRSPASMVSTPASAEPGLRRFGHPLTASRPALPPPEPPGTRFQLHVRQQPRAARAGPDGKDRRTIDPPPVLQLMIEDFDPESPTDMEDLKNTHFVVYCRLVSASSPRTDMSVVAGTGEDGQSAIQRLLLGTNVSNPFFCADDPDPNTMPEPIFSTPSSPSARLMMRPASMAPPTEKKSRKNTSNNKGPGSFFIFADLSVRKAGEYRLEFKLMKMDLMSLTQGSTVPVLHSAVTDVFKVVNAKDFDQVQPSTPLVRGLLSRGAGFPLKLKKGPREGQRTRSRFEAGAGNEEEEDDGDDG